MCGTSFLENPQHECDIDPVWCFTQKICMSVSFPLLTLLTPARQPDRGAADLSLFRTDGRVQPAKQWLIKRSRHMPARKTNDFRCHSAGQAAGAFCRRQCVNFPGSDSVVSVVLILHHQSHEVLFIPRCL